MQRQAGIVRVFEESPIGRLDLRPSKTSPISSTRDTLCERRNPSTPHRAGHCIRSRGGEPHLCFLPCGSEMRCSPPRSVALCLSPPLIWGTSASLRRGSRQPRFAGLSLPRSAANVYGHSGTLPVPFTVHTQSRVLRSTRGALLRVLGCSSLSLGAPGAQSSLPPRAPKVAAFGADSAGRFCCSHVARAVAPLRRRRGPAPNAINCSLRSPPPRWARLGHALRRNDNAGLCCTLRVPLRFAPLNISRVIGSVGRGRRRAIHRGGWPPPTPPVGGPAAGACAPALASPSARCAREGRGLRPPKRSALRAGRPLAPLAARFSPDRLPWQSETGRGKNMLTVCIERRRIPRGEAVAAPWLSPGSGEVPPMIEIPCPRCTAMHVPTKNEHGVRSAVCDACRTGKRTSKPRSTGDQVKRPKAKPTTKKRSTKKATKRRPRR